jgi:hypothetical protein
MVMIGRLIHEVVIFGVPGFGLCARSGEDRLQGEASAIPKDE